MRGRFWVGIMVVGCVSAAIAAPGAPNALDKPAFTATPAELLALGKAAPTGDGPTVTLREQRDISYDEQGRATVRARLVYVQHGDSGGDPDDDTEGAINAEWHPSYQDRPAIRARVITPAGAIEELDPAQLQDRPVSHGAASSDRRYLGAALPAASAGAIIEQEIVTVDRAPRPGGRVDVTVLGGYSPAMTTVISYSAPVSLRLRRVERALPASARSRHRVANGRETWTYEIAAVAGEEARETDTPLDTIGAPYVGAGTAASWEAVARAYRKLFDQRIAAGPVALPAELSGPGSAETVAAIVAWVHKQVRATGPAFEDEVRLPSSPADAVKKASGDRNDKAALLVTLLRQTGIRADVALVRSGRYRVVDPDLPGLGGFDRAIVRARLATGDLWIDPGEPLARPGQLPEGLAGQRALVIADDTHGLSATPTAAPTDNQIHDVRTFTVPELGLSQLTQVVRYSGAFEIDQRRWRPVRPELRKKQHARRLEATFGGTLDQALASDPDDLSRPFEQTFVVKDARRVGTDRDGLGIFLYPGHALDRLPWTVTTKPDRPRRNDFVWQTPHTYEVENRIAIPVGFDLPTPAADRVRQLGPATLTERQRLDGRTLIVTFLFDSGKPRITPAELAALQTAAHEIDEESEHIAIAETAYALSTAGKPREAITECERMIALHPKEPLHHDQLSSVLLRAGAGEAARREARKAVAIAPGDVDALAALGWTLAYDTLGRAYTYDWDRAGAIAALRQARKLDPKHLGAISTLAEVLQRDAAGRINENGDLAGAAEAWRAALAIDKTDANALALARVLAWAGQFAEAEKVARTASTGDERDKWIVLAVAGGSGGSAALKVAGELKAGAQRTQLLGGAGFMLVLMQRYDVGRELLTASGMLAQMPASASSLLAKVKKQPAQPPRPADPRFAAFDVLAAVLDPRYRSPVFWDAEVEREVRGLFTRFIPAPVRALDATSWFRDALVSTSSVQVEGDGGVWRTSLDNEGARYQMYFVLDRGIARLVGATDMVEGIGRYILRASDAQADARARKLLDWVRGDADKATSPLMVTFKRLWGPGIPTSRDAIRLAAAVLADDSDPDRTIPIASQCPSTHPDAELACHQILFISYATRGRWSDAVAQSEAILALRPDRADARVQAHAWALARAGRFDEADRMLDGLLAKDPDHRAARLLRFQVATMQGIAAEVAQRGDAVVNHAAATAEDLNLVAWHRLGLGGDLAAALELARKAVERSRGEANVVNTVAVLEAELGELGRAVDDNWKAMRLRAGGEPDPGDWYVVGRIDEQLGLTADAIAAYKRVTRPRFDQLLSVYSLAQRRLAALHPAH